MPDAAVLPAAAFVVSHLCPVLICGGLVAFGIVICVAVQDGVQRLRQLHQVPCSRCAFFTGDYRLKCTVHPCKALLEEAIDCRDFEPVATSVPRENRRSPRWITKR